MTPTTPEVVAPDLVQLFDCCEMVLWGQPLQRWTGTSASGKALLFHGPLPPVGHEFTHTDGIRYRVASWPAFGGAGGPR